MPFQLEPYRNPNATTIANLIGGADRARAAAMTASADATARGVQSVGEQAGATLNNLVKLKLDEPHRQLQGIQLREAQLTEKDDLAARTAFSQSQGDPDAAVKLLEQQGNYPVAMKLRSQLTADRLRGLDTLNKQLEVNEKRLGQASQLLQSVTLAPTPEAAAIQYRNVLPTVRSIVGADLGAKLPDEYDPTVVKQAMTWGMKASDVLRMQRDSANLAFQGVRNSVTLVQLDDTLTQSLATAAQTAESQEEWDRIRTSAITYAGKDVGGNVLAKFPEQWSPDLKTQAQKFLAPDPTKFMSKPVTYTGDDGKTHITEAGYDQRTNRWFAPNDTEHPLTNVMPLPAADKLQPADIDRAARAVVEDPAAWTGLTDTFRSAIFARAHELGFKVPTKDPAAPSVTAVETLRQRAIRDLNTERTNRNLGTDGMPPQEYDERLKAIEQKFSTPPFVKPTVAPKAPAPAAPAGPELSHTTTRMYQSTAPGAKPIPIPDVVVNAPIPQGQPGIRIRMSDGTIWIKRANGVIEPGR